MKTDKNKNNKETHKEACHYYIVNMIKDNVSKMFENSKNSNLLLEWKLGDFLKHF